MSFTADSSLVSVVLEEPNHSGASNKDYFVVHDIECPPGKDWAESLGGPNWLQNPNTIASVHYIVDADSIVQGVPESLWAWGAGTPGSAHGIHAEQAGYASFTRAQWLGDASAVGSQYSRPDGTVVTYTAQDAADMASQMDLYARLIADVHQRHGWGSPQWMSDADLISASQGNITNTHVTRHAQIANVLGGTVHHDPGTDYPMDVLIQKAQIAFNGGSPTIPVTPSSPTDWLTMATEADVKAALKDLILTDQDVVNRLRAIVWYQKINGQHADAILADIYKKVQTLPGAFAALTNFGVVLKSLVGKK